jgi:putative transcriptional regulator
LTSTAPRAEIPSGHNRGLDSLKGLLLLASPALLDPNFHRAVILIGEHGEGGAMGVVLNRPSPTTVEEALPQFDALVEGEAPIHVGGPVEPGAITMLAEFEDPDDAETLLLGDVGFVRGDADPTLIAGSTRRARIFAGYAGWAPGQLELELGEESWIVETPLVEEIFTPDPDHLWNAVLRRKGGRYLLLSRMPADLSVN